MTPPQPAGLLNRNVICLWPLREVLLLSPATIPFSSLLKNLEIGALAVFLPRVLGRSGCCEQTLTYAVSSLGMRVRL